MSSKSVRLWSSLQNGFKNEVNLTTHASGSIGFQIDHYGQTTAIEIELDAFQKALSGELVTLAAGAWTGSLIRVSDDVQFAFDGCDTIRFSMKPNHIGMLLAGLGLPPPY